VPWTTGPCRPSGAQVSNLLTTDIDIKNSAPGAAINAATLQNALNVIQVGPAEPHP
jgi:hypothetical protein